MTSDLCLFCEGTGTRTWKHREHPNHSSGSKTKCTACDGTGKIDRERVYCPHCGGFIEIRKGVEFPVYCAKCYFIDPHKCRPMVAAIPAELMPL